MKNYLSFASSNYYFQLKCVTYCAYLFITDQSEAATMGLLYVFKDFAANTSIHGLTFLVQPQLSVLRKVSWACIFLAALIYAGRQLNLSFICKFIFFILTVSKVLASVCVRGVIMYMR